MKKLWMSSKVYYTDYMKDNPITANGIFMKNGTQIFIDDDLKNDKVYPNYPKLLEMRDKKRDSRLYEINRF